MPLLGSRLTGFPHIPVRVLACVCALAGFACQMPAQSYNLQLQQISCPAGGTTTLSGTVYAPNGKDPLPNVAVYIPNSPPGAMPSGVQCVLPGQAPPGTPLVGTTTAPDGTFTLSNVPVGANIPLVILSGKWRRQVTIPGVVGCTSNPGFNVNMPTNQTEGNIPLIALATGSVDAVECVLRKVGIADSEFSNMGGGGRINLFLGSGSGGAEVNGATLSQSVLTASLATLSQYDMVMFPCQGSQYAQTSAAQTNMINYANAGGRVYATHFSYVWLFDDAPFSGAAHWNVNRGSLPDGIATVDTSFPSGQTLATWLQTVGASSTLGQIPVSTVKQDTTGVVAPTQSWLTLNDSAAGNPVIQFTFNTPISANVNNQCGRVLFNDYHVENLSTPRGTAFPLECGSGGPMSAQEQLLEYSLFDLSGNGGTPTLIPATQDFGSEPVGITSPVQSFTWTNNSVFGLGVTSATASGDFTVRSAACGNVPAGGSCTITVTFTPTAEGARTGKLTVVANGTTNTAVLTGTGTPDFVATPGSSLGFGNEDVTGTSAGQTVTVTNNLSTPIPLAPIAISGDFAETSNCGSSLAGSSSCVVTVVFKPTISGARTGTLTVSSTNPGYTPLTTSLTGNGLDFTIAFPTTSGTVIAGNGTATGYTLAPLAGFNAAVALSCTTNATASACSPSTGNFTLSSATQGTLTISSTSKYNVVGYGGLGGNVWMLLPALGSGWLLWMRRRSTAKVLRVGWMAVLLGVAAMGVTGCTGHLPDLNAAYTAPGSYTYTLSATDGTITHTATFNLTVTVR